MSSAVTGRLIAAISLKMKAKMRIKIRKIVVFFMLEIEFIILFFGGVGVFGWETGVLGWVGVLGWMVGVLGWFIFFCGGAVI